MAARVEPNKICTNDATTSNKEAAMVSIFVETTDGKTHESMPDESLLPRIIDSSDASASSPAVVALKCMWEGGKKKKKRTHNGGAVASWIPTPIQLQSWSVLLNESDDDNTNGVIAIAPTGGGKTLAYGMGILASMAATSEQMKGLCAICLVPTRELAIQVQKDLRLPAKAAKVRIACVYGGKGQDRDEQITSLKRPNVLVVATPGRLVDLLDDRSDLRKLCKGVQMLVIDEADMMAKNKDSCEQVESIRKHLPDNIRTCLFSATQLKSVTKKWDEWVGKPRVVIKVNGSGAEVAGDSKPDEKGDGNNNKVGESTSKKKKANDKGVDVDDGHLTIPPSVTQTIRMCNCTEDKNKQLLSIISTIRQTQAKRNPGLTIVFIATIKTLESVLKVLVKSDIPGVDKYHGHLFQWEREKALTNFRSGKSTILLATDIAARGIHFKNLEYVINYDFPDTMEQYVHRCGRAGRMQKDGTRAKGTVFSFFTKNEIAPEMARGVVDLLQSTKSRVDPNLLDCVGS